MKENTIVEDKDEVLRAIDKLVNDNGYDYFRGKCWLRKDKVDEPIEDVLCLAVQPKEGDDKPLFHFVVTIGSSRFRITFDKDVPKYCKDLDQMLNIIKDWLLNIKD